MDTLVSAVASAMLGLLTLLLALLLLTLAGAVFTYAGMPWLLLGVFPALGGCGFLVMAFSAFRWAAQDVTGR